MKIAIMQPYLFPYIGYFQLVNAVDKFIFYDDVNFIKGGWINRNTIIINGRPALFTLNLSGASSNKKINEIKIINNSNKILKTIKQNYGKATYFNDTIKLLEKIFEQINETTSIAEIASISVKEISTFLGIKTTFENSSVEYSSTIKEKKEKRLIEICKINNADKYINPIGGKILYKKEDFKNFGIDLLFLKTLPISYEQNIETFIPNLSIIDVIMNNNITKVKDMLNKYELI